MSNPLCFTTLVNMEVLGRHPNEAARACCWTCSAPLCTLWKKNWASSLTTVLAAFQTPAKARNTTTELKRSIFPWPMMTANPTETWRSADVILVGVSRSGKTPTSLYLAMQHGMKAANYPLIPEDFERKQLPPALVAHRKKIFGLSIHPDRLSEIRSERRPRFLNTPVWITVDTRWLKQNQ
jgi:hypothetical protein